jgi:hypothetical protein
MSDEPDVKSILERLKERIPKLERIETETMGVVYMRRQTGEDQAKIRAIQLGFSKDNITGLPDSMFAAIFGAVMLRNEDGSPVFEDPEEGYKTLSQVGAAELNVLYKEMMRISGLTQKVLEDAEKKSSGDQISEPGTN